MQGNDTPPAVLKTANGSLAIERPCETCGTLFPAAIVLVRKGQGRFCSRSCANVAATNPRVECTCLTCGTVFYKKRSDVARGEGLYCSTTCYHKTRAGVERTPLAERFWAKVDKNGPIPEHRPELGPCWVWTAYRMKPPFDYGVIQTLNGAELAHRVSYILNVGPLVKWALHKCDNPPCVRPDHLFEGNAKANTEDQWEKGRGFTPPQPKPEQLARGERNGYSKLTDERVREIRRLDAEGWPEILIAAEIGVHQTTINRVLTGKTWRHVE